MIATPWCLLGSDCRIRSVLSSLVRGLASHVSVIKDMEDLKEFTDWERSCSLWVLELRLRAFRFRIDRDTC